MLRDRVEDHEKQLALAKVPRWTESGRWLPSSFDFFACLQKKITERDRLKLEYDKQTQELEKLRAKTQSDPLKIPQVRSLFSATANALTRLCLGGESLAAGQGQLRARARAAAGGADDAEPQPLSGL